MGQSSDVAIDDVTACPCAEADHSPTELSAEDLEALGDLVAAAGEVQAALARLAVAAVASGGALARGVAAARVLAEQEEVVDPGRS